MKKNRTRFDAIAEELADPKPEKQKKPKKDDGWNVSGDEMLKRARITTVKPPDTYISVRGRAIPVISTEISMTIAAREYEFGRESCEVSFKIPEILDRRELIDDDVMLIIRQGDFEPLVYRLFVTNVKFTRTSFDRYMEVEAKATQLQ